MKKRILLIKTTDAKIEHKFNSVRIFTKKYSKKIKENEFHCPTAAKVIVDTDEKMYSYIFNNAIINADKKGDIEIFAPQTKVEIKEILPKYTKEEMQVIKDQSKFYDAKAKLGLSVDEVVERAKYKTILSTEKLKKRKLSFEKGGGF